MKSNEVKTNIEVGGVVLTEKALSRLKSLQSGNNKMLKDSDRVISDAICVILQNIESLPAEDKPEVTALLNEMAIVRYNFRELAKP